MKNNITKVFDRVYISDGPTAMERGIVSKYEITGIARAAYEFDTHKHSSDQITVRNCGLHDEHPGQQANTDRQLIDAVRKFSRLYSEGRTVLSHCAAGHNRSGAIVVGFLAGAGIFANCYEAYGHIASLRELHIQPLLLQHLVRLHESNQLEIVGRSAR